LALTTHPPVRSDEIENNTSRSPVHSEKKGAFFDSERLLPSLVDAFCDTPQILQISGKL
jgi:hypothetical protein